MRTVTVDLYPNDGLGTLLSAQGLTGKIATFGALSWSIDEQLTKTQPGGLSLKVWDEDGSVWAWIQTQISTSVSGNSQLLPPWLTVYVNGIRRFLGVLDLAGTRRDLKTQIIELSAQDWSVMLRDQVLEGSSWTRPLPRVISTRNGAGPWTGYKLWILGPNRVGVNANLLASVQKDDLMTFNGSGAYKVLDVNLYPGGWTFLTLDGFNWGGATTGSFTRLANAVGDQPYYSVAAAAVGTQDRPIYELQLDTIEHLVPGDVLERPGKGKVNVDDLDSERSLVLSVEPIMESFLIGDKLVLTAESKAEIVQQDALEIIARAASPFGFDGGSYIAPALTSPTFAWLSWANKASGDSLRSISDMEPTLTALRFMGGGRNWIGTPEGGYAVSAGTSVRHVPWTSQRTAAPSSLMPDNTNTLTPRNRDRNRAYFTWKHHLPKLVDANWDPTPIDDSPIATEYPALVVAHDYAALRRWRLSQAAWTEERWSGAAWTAPAAVLPSATSGGPWHPLTAVPYVLTSATTGPTPLGKALLVLVQDASGTSTQLQLHFLGATAAACAVPAAVAKGARLVCTPFGAYLVGPGGYGKIVFAAGSLSLVWAQVVDASSCWLQPHTLAAIDANSLWVLARMDWRDPEDGNKRGSETRIFQLAETPTNPAAVILNGTDQAGVRIMHLPPRICAMQRDPSDSTRLIGILGSRLFQVAAKLPGTLERVKAQGMNAAELIEHAAQVINAIVMPTAGGTLRLIGRTDIGASTNLAVDRVSVSQTRVSGHFFSVVRVSGASADVYADARGLWAGGRSLEISDHPMVAGEAQAYAIAFSYASFLGRPRQWEEQTWFFEDADAAPPWEAVLPWQKITVNGGPTSFLLSGMKEDLVKGTADVSLLEA